MSNFGYLGTTTVDNGTAYTVPNDGSVKYAMVTICIVCTQRNNAITISSGQDKMARATVNGAAVLVPTHQAGSAPMTNTYFYPDGSTSTTLMVGPGQRVGMKGGLSNWQVTVTGYEVAA